MSVGGRDRPVQGGEKGNKRVWVDVTTDRQVQEEEESKEQRQTRAFMAVRAINHFQKAQQHN
jgi:hypothetical protein